MKSFFCMAALALVGLATADFTSGNLVILTVGDGNPTVTGNMPMSLHEYTTAGGFVRSISLAGLAGGRNVTCEYGERSEGGMQLSGDGRFLMFCGYDIAPRSATYDKFLTPRVIGRISFNDTITLSNTFVPVAGDGVRQVYSPDGNEYQVTGGDLGILTGTFSTAPTQLLPTVVSSRSITKVGSTWFFLGSNAGPASGNGVASYDGTTQTALFLTQGATSGRDIYLPDSETMYVLSQAAAGGIAKWKLVSGVWTEQYRLAGTGLAHMCYVDGAIYATQENGSALLKTVDNGTSFSPWVTLATAGTNSRFRGVDFVPSAPDVATATDYVVNFGVETTAPGVANLVANDALYVELCQNLDQEDPAPVQLSVTSNFPNPSPASLNFDVVASADANDRELFVQMFNFDLGDWVGQPSFPITDSDALYTVDCPGSPNAFIDNTSGQVITQITGLLGAADQPTLPCFRFNYVVWR